MQDCDKTLRTIDLKNNTNLEHSEEVNRDLESDSFEQLVVLVPTYDKEELENYEDYSSIDSETSSSSLYTELYNNLKKHLLGDIQNNEDRSEIKKLILALIDSDD